MIRINFSVGATLIVQPFDLIKNRMQLAADSSKRLTSIQVIKSVVNNEGIIGLYAGLTAGLFRQCSYTTVRLGVYTNLSDKFSSPDKPPNFLTKVCMG